MESFPLSTYVVIFIILACPHLALAFSDWQSFLSRSDMIWEWNETSQTIPTSLFNGAMFGNALLGASLYATVDGHSHKATGLRWDLGRSDVFDHRYFVTPGQDVNLNLQTAPVFYNRPRLPIGYVAMTTKGTVVNAKMRLNLYSGILTGSLQTDAGSVDIRTFVHADNMAVVIETNTTGGESAECVLQPLQGDATRPCLHSHGCDKYIPNPPTERNESSTAQTTYQKLLAGGGYAAGLVFKQMTGNHRVNYVTISKDYEGDKAASMAINELEQISEVPWNSFLSSHITWWNSYFSESHFLSIPDSRLEAAYWIQFYKLPSATRSPRMAVDNLGPWFERTVWPGYWWDLNLQLDYWPTYRAGAFFIGQALIDIIENNTQSLIKNVPEPYRNDSYAIGSETSIDLINGSIPLAEGFVMPPGHGEIVGNLLWVCHNYWLQYRHTMDEKLLKNTWPDGSDHGLFPLMKRGVQYYIRNLATGSDGRLHIPTTKSPEYPGKSGNDTNYDISLLRWALMTLLEINNLLKLSDPMAKTWTNILDDLAPYPEDPERGYNVADGVPFNIAHRHFSHLFMIYPLKLSTYLDPKTRDVVVKSIANFNTVNGGHVHNGFTLDALSSMSSLIEDGNSAHGNLTSYMDGTLHVNTMYEEGGNPCFESPVALASSVQDMLLNFHDGTIFVFQAVPDDWKEVVFENMVADGGFFVTAAMHNGVTNFVNITSKAGEPLLISPNIHGSVAANPESVTINSQGNGVYKVSLQKGQSVVLYEKGTTPDFAIKPVEGNPAEYNWWGYHEHPTRETAVSHHNQLVYDNASRTWLTKK